MAASWWCARPGLWARARAVTVHAAAADCAAPPTHPRPTPHPPSGQAEVAPDSNAARSGEVGVGDSLIATSGLTYTRTQEYQGNVVRGGEQMVRVMVRNNSWKTVMAAISSHPAHLKVTLEFQRCQ